jgi:ureidoacrylate peracid hydrolase
MPDLHSNGFISMAERDEMFDQDIPYKLHQSALLFIDVQNYAAHRQGGEFKDLTQAEFEQRYSFFFQVLKETTIPNMQRLQATCRTMKVEVIYTVIESLTRDGRDCSLDFRTNGITIPKASWDAKVLEEIKPIGDEIVFPKSSTSVFISTTIDYVLRNLEVRHLIISGLLTDQCVESTVRNACDLGYLVTLVTDACSTYTPQQHENALRAMSGFCRQKSTNQILAEFQSLQNEGK